MKLRKTKSILGFTIVELAIVLLITGALASSLLMSIAATRSTDEIDRGLQSIHNDIILIRSQAISTNQNHRINFISKSQWKLQYLDGVDWKDATGVRRMPSYTFLTEDTYANAGNKLEATSRGIFEFNGASGEPFITVEHLNSNKTRSINVAVGGALEKVNN